MTNGAPTIPRRPSRDDFSGDYTQDLDGLLDILGDAQESIIGATSGIITPYFRTDLYKHSTETRIRSPLPVGMKCTSVVAVSALGMTLTADGRPSTATYAIQILGNPSWRSLGPTQDNGEVLGITVQYAPPIGYAIASRTAAVNAANGDNIIALDTTELQAGAITHAAGLFTCSAAGIVRVTHAVNYTSVAGGTYRAGYILKNNNISVIYGLSTDGISQVISLAGAALIRVAAGDTLQQNTGQDSGGAIALTVANSRTRADAVYVAADPATTARVRLMFFGE